MIRIYYNSWSEQFKKPFGSIIKNEPLKFQVEVSAGRVSAVNLVLWQEKFGQNPDKKYFVMHKIGLSRFEFNDVLSDLEGLIFYYFEILSDEGSIFYGQNPEFGGEGQIYLNEDNVIPYSLTCVEKTESVPKWFSKSIFYQIFPDRFCRGADFYLRNTTKKNIVFYENENNIPAYLKDENGDITKWDFWGGTLQGVIEKIPYLKKLGISAIYLNPIFEARSNHRYDTADFEKIDSLLGDEEIFKKLVKGLHENGIKIILDGVFNHVGRNSKYFNFDGSHGDNIGAWQDKSSQYHKWFSFFGYDDYHSWWGIKDLPVIDKHNLEYQNYILGIIDYWTNFGVDGWRLDVADELPDFFIRKIRKKLDEYPDKILIGEVWEDASRKISYGDRRKYIYGESLQSVMNYPFRDLIINSLKGEWSAEYSAKFLTQIFENYPREIFFNLFNNIGTHDTERILTVFKGDIQKVESAVSLLMTLPGVPTVYYGDEAGLYGGGDPDNRRIFPWGNQDQNFYEIYKKWINIRNSNSVLSGYSDLNIFYTENIFGFVRSSEKELAIMVVNLSDLDMELISEKLIWTNDAPKEFEIAESYLLPRKGTKFISVKL